MPVIDLTGDLISVVNRDDSRVAIEFNDTIEGVVDGEPIHRKGSLTGLVQMEPKTAQDLAKILLVKSQAMIDHAKKQKEAQDAADDAPLDVEEAPVDLEEVPLEEQIVFDQEPEDNTGSSSWLDRAGRIWYGSRHGRLNLKDAGPDQGDHSWAEVDDAFGPLYEFRDTP